MLANKKTKIVGYLMIVMAVCGVGVDVLDGNGFDLHGHLKELVLALNGAGLVFLRVALDKIQAKL